MREEAAASEAGHQGVTEARASERCVLPSGGAGSHKLGHRLAEALEKNGIPILGTAPDMIDLAEDRDRFQKLLIKLDLNQPNNGIAFSVEQARLVAAERKATCLWTDMFFVVVLLVS